MADSPDTSRQATDTTDRTGETVSTGSGPSPQPAGESGTDATQPVPSSAEQAQEEFARQAEERPPGLIAEFVDFLLHNKKWWLIPIILVLLLLGVLVFLGGSPAAPFIYPGI